MATEEHDRASKKEKESTSATDRDACYSTFAKRRAARHTVCNDVLVSATVRARCSMATGILAEAWQLLRLAWLECNRRCTTNIKSVVEILN